MKSLGKFFTGASRLERAAKKWEPIFRERRAKSEKYRALGDLADAKGLAALELAMILPLALMLMSLVVFAGQAYGVQRRATLAATTVANIFAQANNTNY
jgi:Flp pilus assembly protein TadG